MRIGLGSYVVVTVADGTVLEGQIIKMGMDHIVLDEVRAFWDWVFIEKYNIVEIREVQ